MLAIKNNIMASNAARHLGKSYDSLAKSVERLSSGLRINSAKDDAAGLAVRELIRADVAVLQQGARNGSDGISMLQTMEGAMAVIDENLIRMKELAEQSATGSYSSAQRTIMNAEFSEMADEIERIAGATKFNDIAMLNDPGADDTVEIHVGTTDTISITKTDMTKTGLGIDTGLGGVSIASDTGSGVSGTATSWLTMDDTGAGTYTVTITFTDADGDNEAAMAVTWATTNAPQTFSLQEVVNSINLVSQNLGNDQDGNNLNYTAAESILDSANGVYYLKLGSRGSAMDGITMTAAEENSGLTVTGGWTAETGTVNTGAYFESAATQAGVNILSVTAAVSALNTITTAITTKDTARAAFGYKMNRLESTISILNIQAENLMAAESRISDIDVATEMATLTRTQVLAQAGTAMLAQANSMPQMALTLLR